jgi:putative glutamine amidotransferase
MEQRPRVGITMRIELETDRFYLSRYYSEALEAAGAIPIHLALIPDADYIAAVMGGLDGVLLPGSDSDVDPARYGKEPGPGLGQVHPLKDDTDALVLSEVETRELPLLAICFGMQMLNVSRGGTLVQDLRAEMPQTINHQQGIPRARLSHRLRFLEGGMLEKLSGHAETYVNSHHHQAVENIGHHLIPTAWKSDCIVEALEDSRDHRFVLGVQWHPEIGWRGNDFSEAIFAKFIASMTRGNAKS